MAEGQKGARRAHVIELLLPVRDAAGDPFPRALYDRIRAEMTERFGGVTAFVRAPAQGLWKEEDGHVVQEDIVVFEVMVDNLDEEWWMEYRERVRCAFEQDELIIRASAVRVL